MSSSFKVRLYNFHIQHRGYITQPECLFSRRCSHRLFIFMALANTLAQGLSICSTHILHMKIFAEIFQKTLHAQEFGKKLGFVQSNGHKIFLQQYLPPLNACSLQSDHSSSNTTSISTAPFTSRNCNSIHSTITLIFTQRAFTSREFCSFSKEFVNEDQTCHQCTTLKNYDAQLATKLIHSSWETSALSTMQHNSINKIYQGISSRELSPGW